VPVGIIREAPDADRFGLSCRNIGGSVWPEFFELLLDANGGVKIVALSGPAQEVFELGSVTSVNRIEGCGDGPLVLEGSTIEVASGVGGSAGGDVHERKRSDSKDQNVACHEVSLSLCVLEQILLRCRRRR
jgi:hypothetical protein